MLRIKFPTKCIFRIFPILRTDGMAPFCNLFMERLSYIMSAVYDNVNVIWCYSEKLEDDEDFELIGDISDALPTDNNINDTSAAAANGNDLRTNDGLSLLSTDIHLQPSTYT